MPIDETDLADAADLATLLGLTNPKGVHVYRRRYQDFPDPVIDKGRCVLWSRSAVVAWKAAR